MSEKKMDKDDQGRYVEPFATPMEKLEESMRPILKSFQSPENPDIAKLTALKTETDKNKIDKAIALTADLWNAMMLLPEGYVDQHHDMRFHTHALQNIIKSCNR